MKAIFFSLFLMIFSNTLCAQQIDFFQNKNVDKSIDLLNKTPDDYCIKIPFSLGNNNVITMPNSFPQKSNELVTNFQINSLKFLYNPKNWLEDEKTQNFFQGILKAIYYNNVQNIH